MTAIAHTISENPLKQLEILQKKKKRFHHRSIINRQNYGNFLIHSLYQLFLEISEVWVTGEAKTCFFIINNKEPGPKPEIILDTLKTGTSASRSSIVKRLGKVSAKHVHCAVAISDSMRKKICTSEAHCVLFIAYCTT